MYFTIERSFLVFTVIVCRSYGCGAVFPECVEGCSILDLGSGAGMDCFILSKMVGPKGHVTGVDMTPEQVASIGHFACDSFVCSFSL